MSDPLLNESIVQQLKSIFNEMTHPVAVPVFINSANAPAFDFSRELLPEVASLTSSIYIRPR